MKYEEHSCENRDLTKSHIDKYGLSVKLIQSTDYLPSFAYSIGLWTTYRHPEIICFGLKTKTLHAIINDVADLVKNGKSIKKNMTYYDIFENSKAEFLEVDNRNLRDYFGFAIDFYNSSDFPALQLIWTDRNNKFPWEDNFENEFLHKQPLLDRNADFKFLEANNLAVFTTMQWLDLSRPILQVVHDNNGDWQFLTDDQIPDDIRIVALKEIIDRDTTLNEVFNLEFGETAKRDFIGDSWTRSIVEDDGD